MRGYVNNPDGVIYTTPMEECKTRKPTEQERQIIEEHWEELKRQVDLKEGYQIFEGIMMIFIPIFLLFAAVVQRNLGIFLLCLVIVAIFGIISYCQIKTARGLFSLIKCKEYEVSTFVCQGAYLTSKGHVQVYCLENESGQHIRHSCDCGLWKVSYKDTGYIIVGRGAVALIPINNINP